MKVSSKQALLAVAVIGIMAAGTVAKADDHAHDKVKCSGVNACKGKGACKTEANACKGKNGCKGTGWVEMKTEKECTDKKGKVVKG